MENTNGLEDISKKIEQHQEDKKQTEAMIELEIDSPDSLKQDSTNLDLHLSESQHTELQQDLQEAQAIADVAKRTQTLTTLAPQLPKSQQIEILQQVLQEAQTIADVDKRTQVLTTLAPQILESQHTELQQALQEAQANISKDNSILDLQLPACQPIEDLQKALQKAQAIVEDDARTQELIALASKMTEAQVPEILEAALLLSRDNCVKVLEILATRFPEELATALPVNKFSIALVTVRSLNVRSLNNDIEKTRFLSALAPRIPLGLFAKALSLLQGEEQAIKENSYRVEAFSNLAPYLPEDLLDDALGLIGEGSKDKFHQTKVLIDAEDRWHRTEVLLNLVPYLILEQLPEAIRIELQEPSYQYRVLVAIASRLANLLETLEETKTPTEEIDYNTYSTPVSLEKDLEVGDYLEIAQDLSKDEKTRNQALMNLAPKLTASEPEMLQQALEVALKLENRNHRERVRHFRNLLPIALIHHILKILTEKDEPNCERYRTDILCSLAPQLQEIELNQALDIIKTFQDEGYKTQALKALAPKLLKYPNQLEETCQIVENFQQYPYERMKIKVWSAIDKLDRAKELAYKIPRELTFLQTEAFVEIATHSPLPQCQMEALRAIRGLNHPYLQAEYITRLAPHLFDTQRIEAKLTAQDISEEYYKFKALVALAIYHPELRNEVGLEGEKNTSLKAVQKIELFSRLAVEVPRMLPQLIQIARTINEPLERKNALVALSPHLPARIVREINREHSSGKIISQELWERALKVLARSYRNALKDGSLRNDETQDRDLLNLRDEINSLADLLLLRDLEPPMVVGILGGWGGGKSYIMHLMQSYMIEVRSKAVNEKEAWNLNSTNENLSHHVGHIYQIKFDAWSYAKSNLWASLMQTIFFELNRQITLEQQLKAAGINLCATSDFEGKIWQVLYKTNQADRDYFLNKVLKPEQFQKLSEIQQDPKHQNIVWEKLIWQQYSKIKNEAEQQFKAKESQLGETQKKLDNIEKAKEIIQEQLSNIQIQKDNLEAALQQEVSEQLKQSLDSILGVSRFILIKRFGKPAFEAIKEQILTDLPIELKKQDVDPENIAKLNNTIRERIAEIIETGEINSNGKVYDLKWSAFVQWLRNYKTLIVAFLFFAILSIVLPHAPEIANKIAQYIPGFPKFGFNPGSHIAALIVPLIPALGMAQKLFISGQKWYEQAQQVLTEYQAQVEDKSQKILDNKIKTNQEIQKLEQEIEALNQETKNLILTTKALEKDRDNLDHEVAKAKENLPPNDYASLENFITSRIQDGSYEKHLGLMHQVREDLFKLSYSLLPPRDSEELKIKLENLQEIFPRGTARVVVYIDDLDRCPPDRVVEVLEAVQLLVKTPLFIAVIAIDERYIIRALEKHYAGVLIHRGRPSGSDYLEKIIQIPYRVRPISADALDSYLRGQVIIQDSATGGSKFSEVSRDEFNLLLKCCQEVDLSPRTIKRLTNVYKLFKIVSRTRASKPSRKVQKAILSLLVLSGRYPDLMREIFAQIESCYEEHRDLETQLKSFFEEFIKNSCSPSQDNYLQQEFEKFEHDTLETALLPSDVTLKEITSEMFNLVRSFSFVGDVGYAAQDFSRNGSSMSEVDVNRGGLNERN